jgi:FkbM family methyltransferase
MKFKTLLFLTLGIASLFSKPPIQVVKQGVLYKFVRTDHHTNHFAKRIFPTWENETFEVFSQVKDREKIAIDLGAWIGTTSIWLSKNFKHVIAVEPDPVSIQCLEQNLIASECDNVSICTKPIARAPEKLIFGPRGEGNRLNESTSTLKTSIDNPHDQILESVTLNQLVFDYVSNQPGLANEPIGFIKCDIEGGEEDILEDLLHFASHHQCPVLVSFHYSWWKKKNIEELSFLFQRFKTNCPTGDLCAYIAENPFTSILFRP